MFIKGLITTGTIFLLFSFIRIWVLQDRLPEYLPQPFYQIPTNPINNDTVQLGRLLFYDNILSVNNTVSCASCHSPFNAFAHTDHDLSHGVFDSIGTRNAPGLFNLAWQEEFMWDGAIHHIEAQALAPLHDQREMGSSINDLIEKLQKSDFYKVEFLKVYKDSIINSSRALKALAAFELSLVSFDSKYDKMRGGRTSFTAQEKAGYVLFKNHCSRCHKEPLFSSNTYEDNGLPIDSLLNDMGREVVSGRKEDRYKFNVPTLRNLSFTYPYMHDGRFKKLRQVLDHYGTIDNQVLMRNSGIKAPIFLSLDDGADLVSFLLTLNDKSFVFNPDNAFPKKLLPKTKDK